MNDNTLSWPGYIELDNTNVPGIRLSTKCDSYGLTGPLTANQPDYDLWRQNADYEPRIGIDHSNLVDAIQKSIEEALKVDTNCLNWTNPEYTVKEKKAERYKKRHRE